MNLPEDSQALVQASEGEDDDNSNLHRMPTSGGLANDPAKEKPLSTMASTQPPTDPKNPVTEKPPRTSGDPMKGLRSYPTGSYRFGTLKFLESSIRAQRPQDIVAKPDMVTLGEWYAVHATLFFNHASMLYGRVYDVCKTSVHCRRMQGGRQAEYLFSDGRAATKAPQSAPAHHYIAHLFTWLESVLDDPAYFPNKDFAAYPDDFDKAMRTFVKRVFRVFAHLNYSHRGELRQESVPGHGNLENSLDCILMHLLFFVKHFKLMDRKEFDVLRKRYDLYQQQLGLARPKRKGGET